MKQSYYRRRNAFFSSPGRITAVIALLAVVILIGIRLLAPGVFFALFSPLFSLGNAVQVVDEDTLRLRADRALINENIALSERVKDLMRLVGDEEGERSGSVASVVARPPMTPYDTLLIDGGNREGVVSGVLVSAEGGVPIGTVETVGANYAQVSLFSTSGRETEGWVGDERTPVTLVGEGAGAFTAEVPRDAGVTEGAFVYLPPGARPVGKVARVDADPSSPSATLRIEPLVNIFSLTLVLIELP